MNACLLDTHSLLWWLRGEGAMPANLVEDLADPETRVLVSAVSAMEIATKVRIGKLPQAASLVTRWSERIAEIQAEELPLTAGHALLAGSLPWDHRDPFDRMLAAQAITENLTLVTNDARLASFAGLRTRW